jgi:hypothetical protein
MRTYPEIDEEIMLGRLNLGTSDVIAHELPYTGIDFGFALERLPGGSFLVGGQRQDASLVSWDPLSVTTTDRTGTHWIPVAEDAQAVEGTLTTLEVDPATASGTADTGGGDTDCYIGVHEL